MKDKDGKIKGNRKCHSIMISSGYILDEVSNVIKPGIPLNNITEHREFWHKVWEGKNAADRQKTNIDCKYYMQYEPGAGQNNQIQTVFQQKKGKEVSKSEYEVDDDFLKIKTGLQVSPATLNKLIPKISSHPPLNESQLKAIQGRNAKKIMDSSAIGHVNFKSRRGETCALWVYPEVDLVELNFQKPNSINAYGNVLDLVSEKGVYAKPSVLHFVGTKS